MAYGVLEMLSECESLVKEGQMKTFAVCLEENKLLVQPADEDSQTRLVQLTDELKTSLQIFFDNAASIEYQSTDYNILKSLINAQACINRMKGKEQ